MNVLSCVVVSLVACFVCLVAGMLWGRKIEQKAVSRILWDFHLVDEEAGAAVNRLWRVLPYLEKHFHVGK